MARGHDPDFIAGLQARADAVRQRVTLSSVIGDDIALRKAGREYTGLCPFHGEKRDGAFMVNDAKGFYKCFACGVKGDVLDYVMQRKGEDFMTVLRAFEAQAGIDFRDARQKAEFDKERRKRDRRAMEDAARRRANAFDLWRNAERGAGTPAQRYLEGRGIDFARLGKFPGAIRFRMDLWCSERRGHYPGMVTAIASIEGDIIACHRTYLDLVKGQWVKAAIEKPKMVLGDFFGGFIPLWKGAGEDRSLGRMPIGQGVAISEGIEDGLTVAMEEPSMRYLPAISLANIGNVPLPMQAGDLVLLCQRDGDVRELRAAEARRAGNEEEARRHEKAALQIEGQLMSAIGKQQALARQQGSGRQVRLAWPSPGFKDFNDELRGVRMEGL